MTAVIRQGLNEDWNVYVMYSYKTEKTLPVGSAYSKSTDRQFLVGTEYYVYNQGSLKVETILRMAKLLVLNTRIPSIKTQVNSLIVAVTSKLLSVYVHTGNLSV